jgi:formylmethanofuran dehydrogenase subunit C
MRAPPRQRVDLSPLTPDRLRGIDAHALTKIELACGNRTVPVGDLFAVTPGDPDCLRLIGDCRKLDRIGAGMTGGRISVEGDAGAYLGLGMRSGSIHVVGGVGIGAAVAMHGGSIEIKSRAGDFLGGAQPGEMRGMSGGFVLVRGDAGDRVGDRMRRGTIIVEGSVGGYAASRMIAGTILALGTTIGPYPGFGMRRGSLISMTCAERELPSFADCGRHELVFLRLLFRSLRGISRRLDELASQAPVARRLAGDLAVRGQGELLLLQQ